MKIKIEVSGRHIHCSQEDFETLFGYSHPKKHKDLSQKGQFAAKETVMLINDRESIDNVRVLGPNRGETQVEISKTDAYRLKINPPIVVSGSGGGAKILIHGPKGKVEKECVIIAKRHLHISNNSADKYGIKDGDEVAFKFNGERAAKFNKVVARISETYYDVIQIDTDEANAADIENGDIGELIIGK
jgi:putative phosphotransacetylase